MALKKKKRTKPKGEKNLEGPHLQYKELKTENTHNQVTKNKSHFYINVYFNQKDVYS